MTNQNASRFDTEKRSDPLFSMMIKMFFLLFTLCMLGSAKANCDVYKRTMESIDYWHSYNYKEGWDKAIDDWYAPDGKITIGVNTMPPKDFFSAYNLEIEALRIDVRDIDCAADGEWCHLKVYTTYYGSQGDTVSISQYWTYLYDPVTCLWAHYIILTHNNDVEYMVSTLAPKGTEEL